MKKSIKYTVIVLFFLSIGGYIAFRTVFSQDRLREAFEKTVQENLGRETIVSNARFGVGEIFLEGIIVNQKKDDQHVKKPFVNCEKVRIKFRLLPLLRKKFKFTEIVIVNPEFNIPRVNTSVKIKKLIEDLVLEPEKDIKFEIKSVEVKDGALNLKAPDNPERKFSNINFYAEGTGLFEPINLELDFTSKDSRYQSMDILADIDLLRKKINLNSADINGYGGTVNLTGEIKDILDEPKINCKYKVKKFPSDIIPKELKLENSPDFSGNIKNSFENLKCNWRINLTPCKIEYKDIINKNTDKVLEFQGGVNYKDSNISVNWFVVETASGNFSGTGKINDSGVWNLNIIGEKIKLNNVSDMIKGSQKYINNGTISLNGRLSGPGSKLTFNSELKIENFQVKNIRKLSDIYENFTGQKKNIFKGDKFICNIFIDKKEIKISNINLEGENISGGGGGRYEWGNDLNFTLYPVISGREVGLKIYGDPSNINIGLK
ncbi:MAG: hypothetical protein ACQEQC_00475 [Elusimicrobiota bacterium]